MNMSRRTGTKNGLRMRWEIRGVEQAKDDGRADEKMREGMDGGEDESVNKSNANLIHAVMTTVMTAAVAVAESVLVELK